MAVEVFRIDVTINRNESLVTTLKNALQATTDGESQVEKRAPGHPGHGNVNLYTEGGKPKLHLACRPSTSAGFARLKNAIQTAIDNSSVKAGVESVLIRKITGYADEGKGNYNTDEEVLYEWP